MDLISLGKGQMRVLVVHNSYQVKGGEDSVVNNEVKLLRDNGVEVCLLLVDNRCIRGIFFKFFVAVCCIFSFYGLFVTLKAIAKFKPDVVYVHNYFPILSPSVFWACKLARVPVVHTLHNFRSICPTALLMYDGAVTSKSIKFGPWWALREKVYKNSIIGTFFLCLMIAINKKIGTWFRCVNRFIALTYFQKSIFVEAGWSYDLIRVKSNFIQDFYLDGYSPPVIESYAIFVGRLSSEKGIDVLLEAWKNVPNLKLKIVGVGPEVGKVKSASELNFNIEYLGPKSPDEVQRLMCGAKLLVLPSLCYEGFPMVLIESFCSATPALVSNIGSMKEIVEEGVTGLQFDVGNASELALKAKWLIDNPEILTEMALSARSEYLKKYTSKANFDVLMGIFEEAMGRHHCG